MKKITFLLLLVVSVAFTYAQNVSDPMIIKNELKKRYPNAEKLRWDIEPGSYKATFEENGSKYIVDFDERGNVHSIVTRLKDEEIPEDLNTYVLKQHPGEKYKEVDKITERDGSISYSMRVKDREYFFDKDYKHQYTEKNKTKK